MLRHLSHAVINCDGRDGECGAFVIPDPDCDPIGKGALVARGLTAIQAAAAAGWKLSHDDFTRKRHDLCPDCKRGVQK